MRLLVTTQAVDLDDPALAFFHGWLAILASKVDMLEVICLYEGRHALPANVRIHSLGKERGRAASFMYAARFLRFAFSLRRTYDRVFVHMNPEYVVLLGWWWRLTRRKVVLWYTHRAVNLKLLAALLFANVVVTAAPESLRVRSKKVRVVGHGIDTSAFASRRDGVFHSPVSIVSVGRITPIKRIEMAIDAVALLFERHIRVELTLIGAPTMTGDEDYAMRLIEQAKALAVTDRVHFVGTVPYGRMPGIYAGADLSLNLAPTGGIDKAVLESMAAGCIPFVANQAFAPLLGADARTLIFTDGADLAEKIAALLSAPAADRALMQSRLTASARANADVAGVIDRILAVLA